jgi:hypothetical protein
MDDTPDRVPRSETIEIGRRGAARLRLSIPARLVAVYETLPCDLLDLSRSGARVALEQPVATGEAGFLKFLNQELFATVVWAGQGGNGLEFEQPLSDEQVLEIRASAEHIDAEEYRGLRDEVRAWVAGIE